MNKQLTISNEQLTISNVSRRRVLPSSKASKQRHFSLLTSFLFLIYFASCDLFTGPKADLFKQISKEVDWANAPKLTVTVTFPPEWGNSPQSGDGKCGDTRKGYEFDVEFVPLSGYGFEKWLAFKTADYAGLDKTKSSNEVESSALNGNGVTITEGVSETGARTAKVTIDTLEPVTLVPWCGNRPRLSTQTNPPLNSIQAPFPFDQIVNIWFTMPVKASTIQDNIRVSAILLTDDERGQRGQYMNDNDGITEYFQLKYDADAKGLVDYVELSPKSTEQHPSAHLQLLSISVSVGPGIESEGGVAMAETQVINYQTDTSEAQKAYRPATIQAKRHDGDWFQDGDWNNPTKDRRFNYADDDYKTVQIRFTIPTANIPEGAPSVPNRITIIERLSYDLGGYNANGSIEIPYENVNPSGGYYTINHELQTRTSGIIRLLVLPWYEEDGEPLFQYLEVNNAMAQGQFVTVVMDNAPPGLTDIGAVIGGHVPPVNSGLHIFGMNSIMTLTLNRLSFLNDNGAQGGIPTSQAWNRPWTMDERKDLQWRVLVGNEIESDWFYVEEEGVVQNVFTTDISSLAVDTEYAIRVQFRDTMGNESTNETGLRIKRIEGAVDPVTNLRAVCNTTGNSITVSWTTPNDMLGAYVYVNGAETIINGMGAKSHKFTVPVIDTSGVREGLAVGNVMRYDISVEAYSAAGRAAQKLSVWNIPGMNVDQTNTVLLDNNNFSTALVAANSSGKNFILTEDITIDSVWTPIGNFDTANSFQGVFYGNGYTITLNNGFSFINYTSGTSYSYGGVFGYVQDALIRDLTVVYAAATVTSSSLAANNIAYIGGIVGYAIGKPILNCIVEGSGLTVIANGTGGTNPNNVGGIAGSISDGAYIQNCRAALNLIGSPAGDYPINVGGIIGSLNSAGPSSGITSVGTISMKKSPGGTGINYCGGVVGYTNAAISLTDCVFGGEINISNTFNAGSRSSYIGGLIGFGNGGGTVNNCYVTGNITVNVTDYNGGIYLGGVIGYLYGGSTLKYNIKNSNFTDGQIEIKRINGDVNVGGFVGGVMLYTEFDNCHSRGKRISAVATETGDVSIGGFVGQMRQSSSINCSSSNPVVVPDTQGAGMVYAGGFCGYLYTQSAENKSARFEGCFSSTDVSAYCGSGGGYIGGLIGLAGLNNNYLPNIITRCYATGTVAAVNRANVKSTIYDFCVGGLVGRAEFTDISECYATCFVRADKYTDGSMGYTGGGNMPVVAGGLIGFLGSTSSDNRQLSSIADCYATGKILVENRNEGQDSNDFTDIYTGGLVGFMQIGAAKAVTRNFVTGLVEAQGGGFMDGDLTKNTYVGGIVGYLKSGLLQKNVALSTKVIMQDLSVNEFIARIYAASDLINGSKNYAIDSMLIGRSDTLSVVSSGTGPATSQGENVTLNRLRQTDFWIDLNGLAFGINDTVGGIGGLTNVWDFSSVTGRGYPRLVNVGGQ